MKFFVLFIITNIFCAVSFAQIDTISIKNNNLRIANLKEGTSQYVCWLKNTRSGAVSIISMSERKVSFQKIRGEDVIVIVKHSFNNDTSANKYVYTISDRKNFKTLYDYSSKSAVIEAYNYLGDEINGADSVKQNTKLNFFLKFKDLPYSNELDLETLSALPVERIGQKMVISFYQPGNSTIPKFHPVEVVNEEELSTVNNTRVDCWVIKLSFDNENYDLSWVSKLTHELLRFESRGPTDVFYKVKLFSSDQKF
jgi:hypothetical protein